MCFQASRVQTDMGKTNMSVYHLEYVWAGLLDVIFEG